MFVIAGVSGNTGKVAAEALLAAKQPVRVIVRDAAKGAPWKAKGAEVVVADLNDEAALTAALSGAKAAYLLIPPDYRTATNIADKRRLADVFAAAVKASAVPHVVLLSSIGAQHEDGTGPIKTLHYAEKKLAETGAATTFVRASYFMENWGSGLGPAKATGALYTMFEGAISMVATEDIGKTVARALLEGQKGVINLEGPAKYTSEQVATELTRVFGREVKAVLVPEAARLGALTGAGLTEDLAKLFVEMNDAIGKGLLAFEPGHAHVKGTVTLAQLLDRIAK